MTRPNPRLELTWIGKDARPKLEPRILLEEKDLSHHAAHRVGDADIFDNMLIHGDNLLALKALEAKFTGKVMTSRAVSRCGLIVAGEEVSAN